MSSRSIAVPKNSPTPRDQARMRALVDDHMLFVTRTLSKAGVSRAELDDEVQRTFIAAAGRLDDVRQGAERSFLFQVARNTASHARRTLARRREVLSDHLPERVDAHGTPEDLIVRKQTRNLLDGLLAGVPESLRAVLILYELEGLDGVEISQILAIPRGTVASRLRRARVHLRKQARAIELAWDLGLRGADGAGGARGARATKGPLPMRRETSSALEEALLAGVGMRASPATHALTLASRPRG